MEKVGGYFTLNYRKLLLITVKLPWRFLGIFGISGFLWPFPTSMLENLCFFLDDLFCGKITGIVYAKGIVMVMEVKQGRPFYKYNQDVHDKIIAAIKRNAPYEIAAWSARISEQTLYDWLNLGKEHIKEGKRSEYAQLLEDIFNTESEKVMSHLDAMERGERGWQARLAILERRWHRFFGQYALEFKELFDNFQKLREDVKRYTDSPTEGVTSEVRVRQKVDTAS